MPEKIKLSVIEMIKLIDSINHEYQQADPDPEDIAEEVDISAE